MTTQPSLKKLSGIYHVKVMTAGGKTKRISTGCSSREEAAKVVREAGVEKLTIAAKSGSLTTRVIGQILTGQNLTCDKALEKYMAHIRRHRAANTVSGSWFVLHNWLDEAGIRSKPPSAVTSEHIGAVVNNPESTWKLSTRRTTLGIIRAFFDYCACNGWLIADVSKLVEVDFSILSHEQKEKVKREPFTDSEMDALVKGLTDDWEGSQELFEDETQIIFWLVAVRVARETGLRLSDIAQLERASLAESGKVTLWMQKTSERIAHVITAETSRLISEVPASKVYLFPEQNAIARDPRKRASLSLQFSRLCQRLGVADKGFHSTRRFKAQSEFDSVSKEGLAKRLAQVLTENQIRDLLGHASSQTTRGYLKPC
jgi:integrase